MAVLVENPNPDARARERAFLAGAKPAKGKTLRQNRSALAMVLNEVQLGWLADYATDQFNSYNIALAPWRAKLRRYEQIAEMDRSSRRGAPDPDETTAKKTIFNHSNRSVGLISGFADYAFAQARDDLFGTSPWFAALPEGIADENLATTITRHAHWKFNQTPLRAAFIDALKIACDLGTGFPKVTWRLETETYQSIKQVVLDESGQPMLNPDGSYLALGDLDLTPDDPEPATMDMLVEEEATIYENVEARCIDYNDISFDPTAPDLDLAYTDVFHRFQTGLLDAKHLYGLTDEQYREAYSLVTSERSGEREPRGHRDEAETSNLTKETDANANPPILLVEGYIRCNPFGTEGKPVRIWCVFSPLLRVIFAVDFLANKFPNGRLPIFSVPWFKVPNRITGKGYFERFEDVDNYVDEQFNLITYRDRMAADPIGGYDPEVIDEDIDEGGGVVTSPGKLFKLKPGRKIEEFLSFLKVPDANHRAVELMQTMMQLAQMRTGITSAAQGEMKGLPDSNTATGVRQIVSRGATLLKWPINEVKESLGKPLDFACHLLYANHNLTETFTWNEGEHPELLELKRSQVRNLKLNVTLTMTQSQNEDKLQSGQQAISIHTQYVGLPEMEKAAARPLYVQTIQALGFHGADQIVRQPVLDVAGIATILPPELQPVFLAFAQQQGLIAPPEAATGNTGAPAPAEPPTTP